MKTIHGEASKLVEEFEAAALVFGEIQEEHTLFLQQNQLAELGKWQDERSRAMGRLQQALHAVWGCDALRSDSCLGQSLQEQVGAIVERERVLADGVRACQEELQREMGKVRKGKRAMGSYGANANVRSTGLCFKNSL